MNQSDPILGGGNSSNSSIFLEFSPRKIGEDELILTSIFFKWVGSITNQLLSGLENSSK